MDEIKSIIGKNIREIRQKEKLSQEDLANALGVNPNTIGAYELGRSFPSVDILVKLADYFRVTETFIIRGKEEHYNDQNTDFYERIIDSKEAEIQALKKHIDLLEELLKTKK